LAKQAKIPLTDTEAWYKRHSLNGFLSTPKFIMTLTDISLALIAQTNRQEYLKQELTKINQRLPAAVYIPFVNSTIRNYTVLHIVIDEAKVFQTKERAPLLLCIEAFRPEAELEILLAAKKKKKANDPAREERLDSQGYALVDHDP